MGAIHAYIKKYYLNRNQESPVIVEYSHLKKRWRINTGITVNPGNVECVFDDDLEIYKLSTNKKLKENDRKKLLSDNSILNEVYQKINRAVFELKSKTLSLSPESVKIEYLKNTKSNVNLSAKWVIEWYKEFINLKEKEIGAGINSYRSTFEHFKTFTSGKGVVQLCDLTKPFLEEFREYLVGLGLGGPTIHKQFKNLRILLNWVASQDENDEVKIPSAYKKFKIKARYGDPVGLTVNQFLQFYKHDLSKRKYLERTRDVFAFAVSIGGPRHGDLKRLADTLRKNGFKINQNSISYFEGKTGNAHQEIMLNRIGLEVLSKYNYVMPRVPTNQRMNKNLKAIAKLLKWDEIKYIPKYDNYGKLVCVEESPLKDIFSTKFMRKTAATIDNMLGVPTKTSMKRTGHKTFAAYSRYVDVNKEGMMQANKQWNRLIKRELKEPKAQYKKAS